MRTLRGFGCCPRGGRVVLGQVAALVARPRTGCGAAGLPHSTIGVVRSSHGRTSHESSPRPLSRLCRQARLSRRRRVPPSSRLGDAAQAVRPGGPRRGDLDLRRRPGIRSRRRLRRSTRSAKRRVAPWPWAHAGCDCHVCAPVRLWSPMTRRRYGHAYPSWSKRRPLRRRSQHNCLSCGLELRGRCQREYRLDESGVGEGLGYFGHVPPPVAHRVSSGTLRTGPREACLCQSHDLAWSRGFLLGPHHRTAVLSR